jgi:hypothetical protein
MVCNCGDQHQTQIYVEILERFQSKVLRTITEAPWHVPNAVTKRDLVVLSVRQEVSSTVKDLTITLTDWQNLYFKEQTKTVGLSGITLPI